MVHRPCLEAVRNGSIDMAQFARRRGRHVIHRFAQHTHRNGSAHISAGVAAGASRCNTSMAHRRAGDDKRAKVADGVAGFTGYRSRNMVRRFSFHHRSAQSGSGMAGSAT